MALAKTACRNARTVHTTLHQCVASRLGTALGQRAVVAIVAHAVGKAFNQHLAFRKLLQKTGQLVHARAGLGRQFGLVKGKQHIAQGDQQAALGLLRLQVAQFAFQRPHPVLCRHGCLLLLLGTLLGAHGLLLCHLGTLRGLFSLCGACLQAQAVGFAAGALHLNVEFTGAGRVAGNLGAPLCQIGQVLGFGFVVVLVPGLVSAGQSVARFAQFQLGIAAHGRVGGGALNGAACLLQCRQRRMAGTGGQQTGGQQGSAQGGVTAKGGVHGENSWLGFCCNEAKRLVCKNGKKGVVRQGAQT